MLNISCWVFFFIDFGVKHDLGMSVKFTQITCHKKMPYKLIEIVTNKNRKLHVIYACVFTRDIWTGEGDTGDIMESDGLDCNISVLNLELAIFIHSSNVLMKVSHVALSNEDASFLVWEKQKIRRFGLKELISMMITFLYHTHPTAIIAMISVVWMKNS